MQKKEVISTAKAPFAIGPYSQAVKIDGMIYTSGQIPVDPETKQVVEGGVAEQAHRALQNLAAVVEAAGSSMNCVLKTTVFLKDMDDFAAVNEVYEPYFNDGFPARSCMQVAKLPLDVKIEIEAVAYDPNETGCQCKG